MYEQIERRTRTFAAQLLLAAVPLYTAASVNAATLRPVARTPQQLAYDLVQLALLASDRTL